MEIEAYGRGLGHHRWATLWLPALTGNLPMIRDAPQPADLTATDQATLAPAMGA
jgi:hypothetical protein